MTFTTASTEDDCAVIERLCAGDEGALADAYDQFAGVVFSAALRILIDRQAAEDVTQEVFLFLWRSATSLDVSRGGLRALLVTVARRRAIDRVRREENLRRRQERAVSEWRTVRSEIVSPDFADELVDDDLATTRSIAVRAAVADLPATELAAIDLAYFHGHTLRGVAAATGWPEGTAKSRVRRALRRLECQTGLRTLVLA